MPEDPLGSQGLHVSGFEATLTIHELEQILTAEDAHKRPRGQLLWALDIAAWACQEEGVTPGADSRFLHEVEATLRKDGGDDDEGCLAALATAMASDDNLASLVSQACRRPTDDPNPHDPDPAAKSEDDVEIPSSMEPWAARWFEIASDELGLSPSDLVSGAMTLLVRLRATEEGNKFNPLEGVTEKLRQVDELHVRASKTRHPAHAERLLHEAQALLDKATEELHVKGAHDGLVSKAMGIFQFKHWRDACIAFAEGAVEAEPAS